MALHFVAGPSGAGKSYKVYKDLVEKSRLHPDRQFIVIVPEQFTMQTQKEIVEMHEERGLINLDVLSFNRLAYRVFEEAGGNTLPVLDDMGKSLIVQKVISDQEENLQVLGKALSRQGAVAEMKSLVSELMQYRIEPEDLDAWIRNEEKQHHERLAMKLKDVRTIFVAFRKYLENNYLTTEEVPDALCKVIDRSELVRGATIVLDGFTGFTPVQEKVVQKLLVLADRVTIVMTCGSKGELENSKGLHRLFHMTTDMYRKCQKLAGAVSCQIDRLEWIDAGDKSRFAGHPAMQFMEKSLFRYGQIKPYQPMQEEIRILESPDPKSEMTAVAGQIARMVREEGYHYRDFAIVTGDLDTYGREAVRIFEEAEIPYFLDQKKSIMTNPAVEFIRSAIDMEAQNYSYESVFRFLRSGMTDLTREEADDMETYCLALGIRGRKNYDEKWTRKSRNMPDGMAEYYDSIREKFAELTRDFHEGMHERMGTAEQKTRVLYDFIVRNDIQNKLAGLEEAFREGKDPVREKEYSQVYRLLMDILDRIVGILGEEKLSLADYQAILDAGFTEGTVGLIPPGEDQVMVGDIERTRLKKIKVLFFTGVNDGTIPKPVTSKGILSEIDRENLKKEQVELSPTAREKMYQQRFYLYLALTKPSDHLFLSYSRTDVSGKARMPSYLIGVILKLYQGLAVTLQDELESRDLTRLLETPSGQLSYLLRELQKLSGGTMSVEAEDLIRFMQEDEEGSAVLRALFGAILMQRRNDGIGAELAEKLYGRDLSLSITRLENFTGCAFRHFLDYGLRIRERETYEFTSSDFGSIMHEALQRYGKEVGKRGEDWGSMSESLRNELADQALDAVVQGYNNTILTSTSRYKHMIERLRQILYRTVWALGEQVAKGRFKPRDFEFRFGDATDMSTIRFRLNDRAKMTLNGSIDRIDASFIEDRHYVKIIDYKTGNTDLDLNQVFEGLQLQLSVYMNVAMEAEKRRHEGEPSEPAAIFYYHINDPIIDFDKVKEDTVADEILKTLRPSGLVRREIEIERLFDMDGEENKESVVLPAAVKIGHVSEESEDETETARLRRMNSRARNAEDFRILHDYTNWKVREIGRAMIEGDTAVSPYSQVIGSKEKQACTFCEYRSICGFDEKIPGYQFRPIESRTGDEVIMAMQACLKNGKEGK